MLIWLNGAFGGGKTHTARDLMRRLDDAVLVDPENVGFGLHRALPEHLRGDFQDLASWRAGTVEVLDIVLRDRAPESARSVRGPVIVPMTLVNPAYVDEVIGGLRQRGHDVRMVALQASRETVLARLQTRNPFGLRGELFALNKVDECVAGLLALPEPVIRIDTDDLDIAAVAEAVAQACELRLRPSTTSALGRQLNWMRDTLGAVRIWIG